jgi:tetratricopeptide (TPR) repeat protein
VNEPGPVASDDCGLTKPVFISYATADRKEALSVCKAIERRGQQCWISTRDVAPGENYQEAIVRSLRNARAMVLVFTDSANNSDEIKKELSLASRYHIPVMALRIEDVEPSDAFAYELSTRQWIDAFEGWDKSMDRLVHTIEQMSAASRNAPASATASPVHRAKRALPRRTLGVAVALVALLVAGLGAWLLLRPSVPAAHSMQVRLAEIERLSPDVPAGLPDALRDEIIAAFNDDGLVTVSTAAAPPPGTAPAYALGGSIRREGDTIRIIARLTNERSGVTLWSNSFGYPMDEVGRVPRRIAVDAGNVVRCGLFGAATYPRRLPDPVLADYLQFCHYTNLDFVFSKALYFARKTVAAAPDFSWGWSGIAKSAVLAMRPKSPDPADPLRQEALRSAATALRIDSSNSEALSYRSLLIDPGDLAAREASLKQALEARPLACGCEHHTYGNFLLEVGRISDAAKEFRRSVDVLAFYDTTQFELGASLLQLGKRAEAMPHFDAATDLDPDPDARSEIVVQMAPMTHDYAAAIQALGKPALAAQPIAPAASAAYEALLSGNAQAKARAIAELRKLRPKALTISLLGALGDDAQALQMTAAAADNNIYGARGWLFLPTMDGARRDPHFAGVVQRLGLVKYWKTTHTKPDVCSNRDPPPFCRMI